MLIQLEKCITCVINKSLILIIILRTRSVYPFITRHFVFPNKHSKWCCYSCASVATSHWCLAIPTPSPGIAKYCLSLIKEILAYCWVVALATVSSTNTLANWTLQSTQPVKVTKKKTKQWNTCFICSWPTSWRYVKEPLASHSCWCTPKITNAVH